MRLFSLMKVHRVFDPFNILLASFGALCVWGGSERGLHVKQQCAQY